VQAGLADVPVKALTADSVQPICELGLADTLEEIIEHSRKWLGVRIPQNPVTASYSDESDLRSRRVTPYEEDVLINAALSTKSTFLAPAIILAFDAALEVSDILSLDWSNIYLNEGEIRLNGKNGPRIIPMSERVKATLLALGPKSSGEVFDGLKDNTLKVAASRLIKKTGLDNLKMGDIRHEAIHRLLEQYPLERVWNMTGHKSLASLQRYVKPVAQA
jgi:integrase